MYLSSLNEGLMSKEQLDWFQISRIVGWAGGKEGGDKPAISPSTENINNVGFLVNVVCVALTLNFSAQEKNPA
jgi:hypothetical protein